MKQNNHFKSAEPGTRVDTVETIVNTKGEQCLGGRGGHFCQNSAILPVADKKM